MPVVAIPGSGSGSEGTTRGGFSHDTVRADVSAADEVERQLVLSGVCTPRETSYIVARDTQSQENRKRHFVGYG